MTTTGDYKRHVHATLQQQLRDARVGLQHGIFQEEFDAPQKDGVFLVHTGLSDSEEGADPKDHDRSDSDFDAVLTNVSESLRLPGVLRKFSVENRTAQWHECLSKVRPLVDLTDQKDQGEDREAAMTAYLLCNLEGIVDTFLKGLDDENAIIPVAHCLGDGLAHDVRAEIEPFLPRIIEKVYKKMTDLASGRSAVGVKKNDKSVADSTQCVLALSRCLCKLFHNLRKHIVSDLRRYLRILLGEPQANWHVRNLLGQELSAIVRASLSSTSGKKNVVVCLLEILVERCSSEDEQQLTDATKDTADTLSFVLFEAMRGIGGKFRPAAPEILFSLLESAGFVPPPIKTPNLETSGEQRGALTKRETAKKAKCLVAKLTVLRIFDFCDCDLFGNEGVAKELSEVFEEALMDALDAPSTTLFYLDTISSCLEKFGTKRKWLGSSGRPRGTEGFVKKVLGLLAKTFGGALESIEAELALFVARLVGSGFGSEVAEFVERVVANEGGLKKNSVSTFVSKLVMAIDSVLSGDSAVGLSGCGERFLCEFPQDRKLFFACLPVLAKMQDADALSILFRRLTIMCGGDKKQFSAEEWTQLRSFVDGGAGSALTLFRDRVVDARDVTAPFVALFWFGRLVYPRRNEHSQKWFQWSGVSTCPPLLEKGERLSLLRREAACLSKQSAEMLIPTWEDDVDAKNLALLLDSASFVWKHCHPSSDTSLNRRTTDEFVQKRMNDVLSWLTSNAASVRRNALLLAQTFVDTTHPHILEARVDFSGTANVFTTVVKAPSVHNRADRAIFATLFSHCVLLENTDSTYQSQGVKDKLVRDISEILQKNPKKLAHSFVAALAIQVLRAQCRQRFAPLHKDATRELLAVAAISNVAEDSVVDGVATEEVSSKTGSKKRKKKGGRELAAKRARVGGEACPSPLSGGGAEEDGSGRLFWRQTVWAILQCAARTEFGPEIWKEEEVGAEDSPHVSSGISNTQDESAEARPANVAPPTEEEDAPDDDEPKKLNLKKKKKRDIKELDLDALCGVGALYPFVSKQESLATKLAERKKPCALFADPTPAAPSSLQIQHQLLCQQRGQLVQQTLADTTSSSLSVTSMLCSLLSDTVWYLQNLWERSEKLQKSKLQLRRCCRNVLEALVSACSGGAGRRLLENLPGCENEKRFLLAALKNQLLVSPDNDTQHLAWKALKCSSQFCAMGNKYDEQIGRLIDDKKFTTAVIGTTFDPSVLTPEELAVGAHAGSNKKIFPQPHDRAKMLPLVLRIMYSKIGKKSVGKKSAGAVRRQVLVCVAQMSVPEQTDFIVIMLEGVLQAVVCSGGGQDTLVCPRDILTTTLKEYLLAEDGERKVETTARGTNAKPILCEYETCWSVAVPGTESTNKLRLDQAPRHQRRQIGFLTTLGDVLDQFASKLAKHAQFFFEIVLGILERTAGGATAGEKQTVRLCLQRLAEFLDKFEEYFSAFRATLKRHHTFFQHLVENMAFGAEASALVKFFLSVSTRPEQWVLFDDFPRALPTIFSALGSPAGLAKIREEARSASKVCDSSGGALVKECIDLVLRLARGGVLDERLYRRTLHASKADFYHRQQEQQLNQFTLDSSTDNLDDFALARAFHQTDEDLRKWEQHKIRGVVLLRPHAGAICEGLTKLLGERIEQRTVAAARDWPTVHARELEVVLVIADMLQLNYSSDEGLQDGGTEKHAASLRINLLELLKTVIAHAPKESAQTLSSENFVLVLSATRKLAPSAATTETGGELLESLRLALRRTFFSGAKSSRLTSDPQVHVACCDLLVTLTGCRHRLSPLTLSDFVEQVGKTLDAETLTQKILRDFVDIDFDEEQEKRTELRVVRMVSAFGQLARNTADVEPDSDLQLGVLKTLDASIIRSFAVSPGSFDALSLLLQTLARLLQAPGTHSAVRDAIERLLVVVFSQQANAHSNTVENYLLSSVMGAVLPRIAQMLKSKDEKIHESALRLHQGFFKVLWAGTEDSNFVPFATLLQSVGLNATDLPSSGDQLAKQVLSVLAGYALDFRVACASEQTFHGYLQQKVVAKLGLDANAPPSELALQLSRHGVFASSHGQLLLDLAPFYKQQFGEDTTKGSDLFDELGHLQKLRRVRAKRTLAEELHRGAAETATDRPRFSKTFLVDFAFPLACDAVLQRSLFVRGAPMRASLFDPNSAEVGLAIFKNAVRCLPKNSWRATLKLVRFLAASLAGSSSKKGSGTVVSGTVCEKWVIKALTEILDAYDYAADRAEKGVKLGSVRGVLVKVASAERREETNGGLPEGEEGDKEGEVSSAEKSGQGDDPFSAEQVEDADHPQQLTADFGKSLKLHVIPILRRLLFDKSKADKDSTPASGGSGGGKKRPAPGQVRLPVAGCILHLLQFLPEKQFFAELPRILRQMIEGLRSRQVENRDAARAGLSQAITTLGPQWLTYVVREIRSSLNKGGYQTAVCAWSVHSLLHSLTTAYDTADLQRALADDAVDDAVPHETAALATAAAARTPPPAQLDCSDFLEIVNDELARVHDPDNDPEGEDPQRKNQAKEAKAVRGAQILQLLATIAGDVEKFSEQVLVEFLQKRLLKGGEQMAILAAGGNVAQHAFSTKRLRRIGELFEGCLEGLKKNPAFSEESAVPLLRKSLGYCATVLLGKTRVDKRFLGEKLLDKMESSVKRGVETVYFGENEEDPCESEEREAAGEGVATQQREKELDDARLSKKRGTFLVQPGAAQTKQTWKTVSWDGGTG